MPVDIALSDMTALGSVVLIDIVLAGDNAIVVGLVACGVAPEHRHKVILIGMGAALLCRIVFAVAVMQLLAIIGLMLAGGLLLLWVAWKLWRDLREFSLEPAVEGPGGVPGDRPPVKTLGQAAFQVAAADVSMSLDNVLAVAGAARDHLTMMVFGLVLSIALMGMAATVIARYMQRHPWLGYVGLLVVTYVAFSMIYQGAEEVFVAVAA